MSAKDLGTGNEQKVTITASSNLSEDEIDKAVKDAERFAEEDKKEKERVEIRNHADTLVFQTEKTLKELGDKIDAGDKSKIEAEIANVKTALEGDDSAAIKAAADKLSEVSYDVFGKVYQQADAQANTAGAAPGGTAEEAKPDDDVVDAEYEVVDDDDKK